MKNGNQAKPTPKHYQVHHVSWRGVPLTVSYSPDCSGSYRVIYGRALAHMKIQASFPLPITETGFLSQVMKPERVSAEGGPVAFVTSWLDQEVTPTWARAWDKHRQLSLF